jgi:hypothetical protein
MKVGFMLLEAERAGVEMKASPEALRKVPESE